MDKTAVVTLVRTIKHARYGKFVRKTKRLKAHDEKNEYKVGDMVVIQECRPISKGKHFKIIGKGI